MMLAFLGDPRSKEGALKLRDALRDEEGDYLRRVLAALADVHACDLKVSGSGATRGIEACVYNASAEKKENLAVRVNALEEEVSHSHPIAEPPRILGERIWRIPAAVNARMGVQLYPQAEALSTITNAKTKWRMVSMVHRVRTWNQVVFQTPPCGVRSSGEGRRIFDELPWTFFRARMWQSRKAD
jgi:hypothetical protein